jgi:hypothetical protein
MSLSRPGSGRFTTPRPISKAARPETVRQAERWDVVRNLAGQLGLCDRCAPQYADGIAVGFAIVHPPCTACVNLLETFGGQAKPSGWRVLPSTPRHLDTRSSSSGPQTRPTHPARGIDGYGRCLRCGESWTGFTTSHCSGCHQTFAGIQAFDAHRVGTYAKRGCADPAVVDLVKISRPHWVGWGRPDDGQGGIV